ncbi:N-acyl-D-amino-acid deacylase family protein [Maledivibacter halophilus]|uniref:N-acyl-D-amino-acid deacylase n=1 Tax=Maledivibacter halophilus TaxID=36842 RepID=A0A1T5L1L8_9FIRM|nr:D-aminoacylase [Maledivibacter halophilus]SKC69851.1 N-acyl-D-amino-acid deacylase [Maledivibacter halophilus]
MKILIRNGLIADGSLNKPFKGDILIEDDKIKKIGALDEGAEKIIDARNKVVSPGFIDTHSHSDLSILLNPYNEIKIRQGVTTEILGQDGISMAPLPRKYISSWRKINSAFNGDSEDINWEYKTTENYLNMMEKRGVGLNQGYLVPHGNIRLEAIGLENKKASKKEIEKMVQITKREMEGGALGLSTGLIYFPCAYGDTKELIELCKVVAEFHGIFAVHQRSEANDIIESMKEILTIGRESGVKIHFSHFKVCGKNNWKYIDEIFELLEKAKDEAIKVSFDQYPYVAGSTSLGVILPPWVHEGGRMKLLERLESKLNRERIINDIETGLPGWDNFIEFAGPDKIFITSVKTKKNKDIIGKNLIDLGKLRGKDSYNAVLDLIYEEENLVEMVDFYGLEEHIIKFLKRPEQNICTDGMLSDSPHPRLYGSFPRILERYVRKEKVLSLEEAIYKMTKKAAETFKLDNRGEIREGYFADIVIFDLGKIKEKGNFIMPKEYPEGIDYVIINGNIVLENKKYNKILAGRVVRG